MEIGIGSKNQKLQCTYTLQWLQLVCLFIVLHTSHMHERERDTIAGMAGTSTREGWEGREEGKSAEPY